MLAKKLWESEDAKSSLGPLSRTSLMDGTMVPSYIGRSLTLPGNELAGKLVAAITFGLQIQPEQSETNIRLTSPLEVNGRKPEICLDSIVVRVHGWEATIKCRAVIKP